MRRRFSLEKLFYFLSNSDDYILCFDPPDPNFLIDLKENGWILGTSLGESDLFPDEATLVEWGNLNDYKDGQISPSQSKTADSAYLNSKLNQREWKQEKELSVLASKWIGSEDSLHDYLNETEIPIVLKGKYGLAGRNHIILDNPSQGWKLSQIPKKLFHYPIFAEEWVGKNRFLDFSTLWEFNQSGPLFLGTTEMLIEEDGSFRGIRMSAEKEKKLTHVLPRCLEVMKIVYETSDVPPMGPAAMDGFLFRKNDIVQAQVFSEINFRNSMGRILFEIRKKRNLRIPESGIVFLPLNKIKVFDEWKWLNFIRRETNLYILFVTPVHDSKKKLFQNVGLYYEMNENNGDGDTLLSFIGEEWRKLSEN